MKTAVCVFLSVICLFGGTGCHFHKDPPKSIDIDGEKYVTGFYDGMYTTQMPYMGETPYIFETDDGYEWRKVENSVYGLYYCEHRDSLFWSPTVYCRKSQFDEVKAYYQTSENYEYYFMIGLGQGEEVKIPDGENKDLLNEVVLYSMARDKNSSYDPFAGKDYATVTHDLAAYDYNEVNIFRTSCDGIFTSTRVNGFYYFNDNLYALKEKKVISGAASADNTKTFYLLEGETYSYILSLFKEYALPEIIAKEERKKYFC